MRAFARLADPTRRPIVELLAERNRDAGELAGAFTVSRPAVSRHLRVLRESGLMAVRPRAQHRAFSLDARPLDELASWLDRPGRSGGSGWMPWNRSWLAHGGNERSRERSNE